MLKNIDQRFPQKKDKREAAEHLNQVAISKGWAILQEIIDDELQVVDTKIKTTKFSAENLSRLNELQTKWVYLKILRDLPKELVQVLLDEKSPEELKFDVY